MKYILDANYNKIYRAFVLYKWNSDDPIPIDDFSREELEIEKKFIIADCPLLQYLHEIVYP